MFNLFNQWGATYMGLQLGSSKEQEQEHIKPSIQKLLDLTEVGILKTFDQISIEHNEMIKEQLNKNVYLSEEYQNNDQLFTRKPHLNSSSKYEIHIGGAGGLAPYLMGVMKVVQDHFHLELSKSVLIGTSAGSYVAYILASNTPMDQAYYIASHNFIKKMDSTYLGKSIHVLSHWEDAFSQYLTSYHNSKNLKNMDGKLFINTQCYLSGSNYIINHFDSHKDLVDATVTSSVIPGVHTSLTVDHHGRRLRDGWFAKNPYIFPHLKRVEIYINRWRDFSWYDYLPTGSIEKNDNLYHLGQEDAKRNIDDIRSWFF